MSASLVGSEMCIRDRIGTTQPGSPRRSHCRAIGGNAPLTASGPHSGAVSYTHLTLPTICSV
eukprot:4795234-Alexandrium_andersonii.AAC.1